MKRIIVKSEVAKGLVKDYVQTHKAFRNIWRACDRGNRYTEDVPKWLVVRVEKKYEAARDALFCLLENHTGREVSHINENTEERTKSSKRKHSADYSTDEYVYITTYESLLKHRDYPILKAMMIHNGHFRKGRQKVTAITPIVNKLKEIIKEVF